MLVKRLFRQHSSTLLIMPKEILNDMDLQAGDYVTIDVVQKTKLIRMTKVIGRIQNERSDKDSKGKRDQSGEA